MICLLFISENIKVLFLLGLINTLIIDLNISILNNFKIGGFVGGRGITGFRYVTAVCLRFSF
jgi:hypothetical protein